MKQAENAIIHAVRRGNGIHKWVEDKTASGSLEVLTDTEMVYNIPVGMQVLVCEMSYNLETVSDNCEFEVVSMSAVDGGGTATRLAAYSHIFTASTNNPNSSQQRLFICPMLAKYSDGARSVTMRIHANDSAAVVTCGWSGIVEKEV